MSELKKKIVTCLCAVTSLGVAFSFAACEDGKTDTPPTTNPPEQTQPENPSTTPEDDKKEEPKEEEKFKPESKDDILALASDILGRMKDGKNFTMKTGDNEKRFDSQDGVDKLEEIVANKEQKYVETAQGKNFQYSFDNSDNKWHKTLAQASVDSQITDFTDPIYALRWNEYNLDDISMTSRDKTTIMTFDVDKTAATGFTISKNGIETKVSAVGTTKVNLPVAENVVDETKQPVVDPTEPEEEEYIYTDQDGWNATVLIDTLDQWLRETNYITKKWNSDVFKKVLSVTPTANDLIINTLTYTDGEPNILSLQFRENFYKDITENGNYRTTKELLDKLNPTVDNPDAYCYLVSATNARKAGKYSSEDDNYAEFKDELDLLTEYVFDRIETIGIQKQSAKIDGEANTEYKNAKIKFACKDEPIIIPPSYDIGASKRFHLYYIVENNGKNQFLEFTVFSSIEGVENANELKSIFEDHPRLWMVQDLKATDIVLSENFESNLTKQTNEVSLSK